MVGSKLQQGVAILVLGTLLALPGLSLAADQKVTFSKDVAPILQAKCQNCHEPGSIAPMSLRTFEEARPWAKSIRQRVSTRQMPPWHIDRSVGVQKFKNDMSLTDEQVQTIVDWVDQGARAGESGRHAAAQAGHDDALLAGRARRLRAARPHREVSRVHHAGGQPGSVVAPDGRHPRPQRAALGEDGRDPADQPPGPQDPAPFNRAHRDGSQRRRRRRGRPRHGERPPRPSSGRRPGRARQRPAVADGVGDRQGLRPLPRRHRQADQAGPEDLLGPARPRRRRGSHGRLRARHLALSRKARSRNIAAT